MYPQKNTHKHLHYKTICTQMIFAQRHIRTHSCARNQCARKKYTRNELLAHKHVRTQLCGQLMYTQRYTCNHCTTTNYTHNQSFTQTHVRTNGCGNNECTHKNWSRNHLHVSINVPQNKICAQPLERTNKYIHNRLLAQTLERFHSSANNQCEAKKCTRNHLGEQTFIRTTKCSRKRLCTHSCENYRCTHKKIYTQPVARQHLNAESIVRTNARPHSCGPAAALRASRQKPG